MGQQNNYNKLTTCIENCMPRRLFATPGTNNCAGGGAAIIGGAIGIPLLFKQARVWDDTM